MKTRYLLLKLFFLIWYLSTRYSSFIHTEIPTRSNADLNSTYPPMILRAQKESLGTVGDLDVHVVIPISHPLELD